MAAKRLFCETESILSPPLEKKRPRQTFASIIGEVVMGNSLRHLTKALEPLLRRVVCEEVDRSLMRYSRSLTRASSLRIQALEPSSYQLYFVNNVPSKIFTGSKITDVENQALRIAVEDGGGDLPSLISSSVKVEIVALNGDFPGDKQEWTADEFNANIVKERTGRRPLLHGDMNVTLRHGAATIGDIEFTDNSCWIRSRKFRLGARIVPGPDRNKSPRIREAISEPFVVNDHRGELYKKHYPPMLHDEVWRLEKIGKEGVFHRRLNDHNIRTVQEFLQLFTVDQQKLRTMLGMGMSERMWEATTRHAKTCELGHKLYLFRGHNFTLFLNPIYQVVQAIINGRTYAFPELHNIHEGTLKNLRKQAFDNRQWLQDIEGNLSDSLLLLTQGNEESDYNNVMEKSLIISGEVEGRDWESNSDQIISTSFQGNLYYNYS
ncbi:protein SAR DEFICIENT 1-like [Cucurbita maxima]|uniref:Protein SAR DEFICIENT 1-like n=1 Tax=Cucurbita maxima TaxID=3661 RepID=A0A6J1K0I5_CUCMA|nr:protein SAR DEFICIENT 1-like [Cucurbita maxima]